MTATATMSKESNNLRKRKYFNIYFVQTGAVDSRSSLAACVVSIYIWILSIDGNRCCCIAIFSRSKWWHFHTQCVLMTNIPGRFVYRLRHTIKQMIHVYGWSVPFCGFQIISCHWQLSIFTIYCLLLLLLSSVRTRITNQTIWRNNNRIS